MPYKIFDHFLTALAVIFLVIALPLFLLLDLVSLFFFRVIFPAALFLARVVRGVIYRDQQDQEDKQEVAEVNGQGQKWNVLWLEKRLRSSFWSTAETKYNFKNADLDNLDLHQKNFENCNMENANLSFSNLSGSSLKGADLRHAILCNTDLSGADLEAANLEGAYFSEGTKLPFSQDQAFRRGMIRLSA